MHGFNLVLAQAATSPAAPATPASPAVPAAAPAQGIAVQGTPSPAPAGAAKPPQQNPWVFPVFIGLLFVAFYLMAIRPQKKQQRAHEQMLSQLKAGDRVVTTSGIYGTITSVSDKTMMLRISDNSVIEIARPAVAAKVDAAAK